MAGETEDCINLQAECLPTGSISFGRFENESLSWEKRSSFSHNRYLEEVEKYSTPGSVTQKKAYFEAHYKKKGLLHQTSSLSQSGSEGHRGDYGVEGQTNHMDKSEDDYNESGQYVEEFHNHEKDGIQFSWYDESPLASDEIVHEVVDGEGEVTSVSVPIDIVEDVSNTSYVGGLSAEYAPDPSEYNHHAKQDQSQINDEAECIKTMTDHIVTHERDTIQEKIPVKGDGEPVYVPTKTKKSSSKGKSLTERKTSTLKSKIQSGVQTARKSSAEKKSASSAATLTVSKVSRKSVKEIIVKPNSERPSSQRVSLSASASRNKKPEPLTNAKGSSFFDKAKEKPINRSKPTIENNLKTRKSGATPPEKRVPSPSLSGDRSDSRASAAGFSFKSDERAEKRKEFFMKLEEKLHAKEVQMNEIQARTQEEKDAAMKQFRKSLNFKATPMPSFYHEPSSGVSDGKKAPRTTAKSTKNRVKHEISMNGENNIDDTLRIQKSANLTAASSDQSSTSREQGSRAPEGCAEAVTSDGQDQTNHSGVDSGQDPFSVTATASETAEPAKENKNKIKLRQQHPQQGTAKSKKEYKTGKGTSSSHGKTVKAISGSAGTRTVRVVS